MKGGAEMKKIFGITLALFAAFAVVFMAFRPAPESPPAEGRASQQAQAVAPAPSPVPDESGGPGGGDAPGLADSRRAPDASSSGEAGASVAASPVESLTWLEYFKEGQKYYSERDYASACRAFESAAAENDPNFYLHYMLGLSQWKNGRHERAAGELNRSLELNPSFVKGWVNLARVRRELGDPQEAVALCDKALAIDESSDDAWNVSGLSQLDAGDRAKAVECFKKAIAANPDNAFAMNNLALTYIYEERYEEALLPLEQAVEIAPGVAFIHNNLGVVYEHLGRNADAARQYAAAVDAPAGHAKAEASLKRILPLLSVEEEARLAEFYQVER
jgi:tetratricopeptide (TPR) repeat protein